MNHKILIIAFSWLTTIAGLVLLSSPSHPNPKQQTVLILATPASSISVSPTAYPSPIKSPPLQASFLPTPVIIYSPAPASTLTSIPTPSLTPTPSPSPSPSVTRASSEPQPNSSGPSGSEPTPSVLVTPLPSTTSTPAQTPTPPPTVVNSPPPSGHTFYTSSHWKAKYYYCDTDPDWQNLSPTYLKIFSSEQELLTTYSRVFHEPCKN